jgi:hypothetical protein
MKPMIEARLEELRREYEAGAGVMNELQKKQDELRTTLMRISGAIQVLEELLATEAAGQDAAEAGGPRPRRQLNRGRMAWPNPSPCEARMSSPLTAGTGTPVATGWPWHSPCRPGDAWAPPGCL